MSYEIRKSVILNLIKVLVCPVMFIAQNPCGWNMHLENSWWFVYRILCFKFKAAKEISLTEIKNKKKSLKKTNNQQPVTTKHTTTKSVSRPCYVLNLCVFQVLQWKLASQCMCCRSVPFPKFLWYIPISLSLFSHLKLLIYPKYKKKKKKLPAQSKPVLDMFHFILLFSKNMS